MTAFLFRPHGDHIFLSSEDPSYRYVTLCGRCEYPIEPDEPRCPRCQEDLEDCPVCRRRSHKRAPKTSPLADGRHQCTVCGIFRYPVGHQSLVETDGAFCSNLYGCPAGGLITHQDEIVYWPPDADVCQVCRNADLPPLPTASFTQVVRQCLFCSALFGLASSRRVMLREDFDHVSELPHISATDSPCVLCGRNDDRSSEDTVRSNFVDPWDFEAVEHSELGIDAYLRVVELGRALVLFSESDNEATKHLYRQWVEPHSPEVGRTIVSHGTKVADVVDYLIRGTLDPRVRKVLQKRLDGFIDRWNDFQLGLSYVIPGSCWAATQSEEEPR